MHHLKTNIINNYLGSKAQRDALKAHAESSKVLPYQVRVGQCVGSLIKLDWILTAKHCVSDVKWSWDGRRQFGKHTAQTVWAGAERRTIATSDISSDPEEGK